jgi:hypothetical protein
MEIPKKIFHYLNKKIINNYKLLYYCIGFVPGKTQFQLICTCTKFIIYGKINWIFVEQGEIPISQIDNEIEN